MKTLKEKLKQIYCFLFRQAPKAFEKNKKERKGPDGTFLAPYVFLKNYRNRPG